MGINNSGPRSPTIVGPPMRPPPAAKDGNDAVGNATLGGNPSAAFIILFTTLFKMH